MSQGDEQPRVVIRDKRRIDPTTGALRAPAGEQPAGVRPGTDLPGEQMSEHDTAATGAEQGTAPQQEAAAQQAGAPQDAAAAGRRGESGTPAAPSRQPRGAPPRGQG